jgi:hypothetical protein
MFSSLMLSTLVTTVLGCQSAAPPSTQPATAPTTQPSAVDPALVEPDDDLFPPDEAIVEDKNDIAPLDPGVGDVLARVEAAAKDLESFTADIAYEKESAELGRREVRTGQIIYRVDPETKAKSFAILFDFVIVNRVRRENKKHYIFNGRWLVEIDEQQKQFIKREIVPPGKTLDPLKLGEGPFPLPIGQSRDEVLARFDVTKPEELPDEALLKDIDMADGLLLVPKPGTAEFNEFARVEIYYDRATSLPVGIFAVEADDGRKIVRLRDLKRNPTLDAAELKKLDIAEPDPKEWRIDIRPWAQQKSQ